MSKTLDADLVIVLAATKDGKWTAIESNMKLVGQGDTVYEAVFALQNILAERQAPPNWLRRLVSGLRLPTIPPLLAKKPEVTEVPKPKFVPPPRPVPETWKVLSGGLAG